MQRCRALDIGPWSYGTLNFPESPRSSTAAGCRTNACASRQPLEVFAVYLPHLESIGVEVVQAADVDGCHLCPRLWILAERERLDPTSRTELVTDHVPVEFVACQGGIAGEESELCDRRECEQ